MEMHVNDQNGQINSLTPSEWNSMYVLRMARTKTAVICRRPDPTTKAEPFWKTDRQRQEGEKESTFGQYINRKNVTSKRWLTSSILTLRLKYLKPTGANHNWKTLTMWLNHNEPDDRWWQKIRLMTTVTSLPKGTVIGAFLMLQKSMIGMSEPSVAQTWFNWMKTSWMIVNPCYVLGWVKPVWIA